MRIYEVTIHAPAVDEVVTLAADSPEEAKALAVASALARLRDQATVTVEPVPDRDRAL